MQLESLYMSRQRYGDNEGKLTGEITFSNPQGKIQIVLGAAICQRVLALCAEGLVETAKDVAQNLTRAVLEEAQPQLEQRDES